MSSVNPCEGLSCPFLLHRGISGSIRLGVSHQSINRLSGKQDSGLAVGDFVGEATQSLAGPIFSNVLFPRRGKPSFSTHRVNMYSSRSIMTVCGCSGGCSFLHLRAWVRPANCWSLCLPLSLRYLTWAQLDSVKVTAAAPTHLVSSPDSHG